MEITTQLYTRLALALLVTMGGIGTVVAQSSNTAFGKHALISNTSGDHNSAFGYSALEKNKVGMNNNAVGDGALALNDDYYNDAFGTSALASNTRGTANAAFGDASLLFNTTGSFNSALGGESLFHNTTGSNNVALGAFALWENTTGNYNSAFGLDALYANSTGTDNTASGESALVSNTTGSRNTASGAQALFSNKIGSNNIGIGNQAGYFALGSNNIEIGNSGVSKDNNAIRIGSQGTQKFVAIAGISGVNVTGGAPVVVNSKGQLGVVSSSRRYKEDIHSMGTVSDRLLKLHPVTFRYKQPDENGQKPKQYGLIAEDVVKVMPELVIYNDKGQPETVAYQTLTPLLLNELQREHKQLSMQGAELEALRAEVAELRRLTVQSATSR